MAGNVDRITISEFSGKCPACKITFVAIPVSDHEAAKGAHIAGEDSELKLKRTIRESLMFAIRQKASEGTIDAFESTEGANHMRVEISCVWKSPVHSLTVRRLIQRTLQDSGFRYTRGDIRLKYSSCDGNAVRTALLAPPAPGKGLRWLQFSEMLGTLYDAPMEEIVQEISKAVEVEERRLVICETSQDFKEHAISMHALLYQIADILAWKMRQVSSPPPPLFASR